MQRGYLSMTWHVRGAAALLVFAFVAQAAAEPFQSTYQARPGAAVLIRNATVLDGTGRRLDGADVLIRDGKVAGVGPGLERGDATEIDAQGRWVTPGLIDAHSHLGVYSRARRPRARRRQRGDRAGHRRRLGRAFASGPRTPDSRRALAGGVTTMQVLPGSANLIGGRGVDGAQRAGATAAGDEVPRRAARPEDGLRREPEARLRRPATGRRRPAWATSRLARGLLAAQDYARQWDKSGRTRRLRQEEGEGPRPGANDRRRPTRDLGSRRWSPPCTARSWSSGTATAPTRCS